jgi:threonine dehydrogenase-like Zn-dependent dehydrogenase
MAKKLGADAVINAAREDPYQKVLEITGSNELSLMPVAFSNVDTVFDCAGNPTGNTGTSVLWQSLIMVRQDGKVVMVAIYEKAPEIEYNLVVRKGIKMLGSWGWGFEEFRQALELIRSGKIDRKPLITHEFPLAKAKQAYETQLRAEEAIKVLIKP